MCNDSLYVQFIHNSIKELNIVKYYEVRWYDLHPWCTRVSLVGFDKIFNGDKLKFYEIVDGEYVPYDIFDDPYIDE